MRLCRPTYDASEAALEFSPQCEVCGGEGNTWYHAGSYDSVYEVDETCNACGGSGLDFSEARLALPYGEWIALTDPVREQVITDMRSLDVSRLSLAQVLSVQNEISTHGSCVVRVVSAQIFDVPIGAPQGIASSP